MMKKIAFSLASVVVLALALPVNVPASDFAKEKRWADQIVDSILVGEAIWLTAGGQKFLGIYTESMAAQPAGGVIIVHGVGVHPNWTDVVHPLRTQLPEFGWYTLALQMPILPNDAETKDYAPLFPEIAPRIDAGVEFLKQKGITNIIIIGHSMGATMAGYYMANDDRPEVKALVAIGAPGLLFKDPSRDFFQSIKKISKPIMDLSGSEDLPEVLETKRLKMQAARERGHTDYVQFEIQGANHFLVGKENEMIRVISNWIKQFAK